MSEHKFGVDIPELQQAEQAQQAQRRMDELFRALIENVVDVITIIDAEGVIRYHSPSLEPVLGYKPAELIGVNIVELLHPDDVPKVNAAIKAAAPPNGTPGIAPVVETRFRHKDGSWRNLESICKKLPDIPSVTGTVINSRDITERKRAEENIKKYSAELIKRNEEIHNMTQQLWQAAKLATMGELVASIAHELNNPLTTVSLRIESLTTKTSGDDPHLRELEIIGKEVERMGDLIKNLLQFSRRSQQEISTVFVCEEIEKTLELIHYHLRKYNIEIIKEFAHDVPKIHADRQQLRQIFLNLFINASDAMPQGGTLTIRVTTSTEEKQVHIEIADTGVGIPPEILPKVTEPFYTTKPEGKGTGLGLAICRRIVKEHNGKFDLTSEGVPGMGTTVRISLPVTNGRNVAGLKDKDQ